MGKGWRAGRLGPWGTQTPEERFWAKVEKTSTCWLWRGSIHKAEGYGRFRGADGRVIEPHRFAYEALIGPIPAGLVIDHICRVRHCVNPAHLEPVTTGENGRRGISPWAINARKTQCIHGHPFDAVNTYHERRGGRQCRICTAASQRRYQERLRAGH